MDSLLNSNVSNNNPCHDFSTQAFTTRTHPIDLPRMTQTSAYTSDQIKSPSSCHPAFAGSFSFDDPTRFHPSNNHAFQPCDPSQSICFPAHSHSDQIERRKRHSGTTTTTTSGSEESGDHFFGSQDDHHHDPHTKLTSEKRKAQNRTAQRNFRERKDRQSKENEESLVIRTEENKQMCALIETLEAENDFLRQNIPTSVLAQLSVSLSVSRPVLGSIGLPPRPSTPTQLRRDVSQGRRLKKGFP